MKGKRRLTNCPVCGGTLKIVKYRCDNCSTEITGSFEIKEFANLSDEQLLFLKIFIKNKGNLSELQKELNISYPTAKARLEDLVSAMGYESKDNSRAETFRILEKIEKGELTPEEAKELLKKRK